MNKMLMQTGDTRNKVLPLYLQHLMNSGIL